jgi:hypothetical protein
MAETTRDITEIKKVYPFMTPQERLLLWRKIKGMWKGRKPDMMKEYIEIRKEFDRDLPPFRS